MHSLENSLLKKDTSFHSYHYWNSKIQSKGKPSYETYPRWYFEKQVWLGTMFFQKIISYNLNNITAIAVCFWIEFRRKSRVAFSNLSFNIHWKMHKLSPKSEKKWNSEADFEYFCFSTFRSHSHELLIDLLSRSLYKIEYTNSWSHLYSYSSEIVYTSAMVCMNNCKPFWKLQELYSGEIDFSLD